MAEATFSFDLHVLGTPPAFVLSQDQTLQLNIESRNKFLLPYTMSAELKKPRPELIWPVNWRLCYLVFKDQKFSGNLDY